MEYDTLIQILEQSVKRHGEKPLTNEWLLNILRMAENKEIEDDRISYFHSGIDD